MVTGGDIDESIGSIHTAYNLRMKLSYYALSARSVWSGIRVRYGRAFIRALRLTIC